MPDANLASSFEEKAAGEPILFAVIGEPSFAYAGVVLPWAQARIIINYEYDSGFGPTVCHAAYAWTETKVLFVHEYDGATDVHWLPRNPTAGLPEFGGNSGG